MKAEHNWARLLAYVTGLVNQELLLQNEYLAAENRILRSHLPTPQSVKCGARHLGGDRKESGTQSARAGGLYCQTGHHPGLVPPTGGRQVRWVQGSDVSR